MLISNLWQHRVHLQPPPSTKRSHHVFTIQTHNKEDYGATPFLTQVDGGCYSPGEVLPPHSVGEDLDMYTENKNKSNTTRVKISTMSCVCMYAFVPELRCTFMLHERDQKAREVGCGPPVRGNDVPSKAKSEPCETSHVLHMTQVR
jgi:hypothetical protein